MIDLAYIIAIFIIIVTAIVLSRENVVNKYLISLTHQCLLFLPSFISSRIYSIIFLLSLSLKLNLSLPILNRNINLDTLNIQVSMYASNLNNISINTRTIVIIHGLAESALHDPRIKALAHALACANPNNLVLVPYVDPLAKGDISQDPCGTIQQILNVIHQNNFLCPTARISLVSPCISGGICIAVASRVNFIDFICTIGAHAHAHNVLDHCISRKGKDDSQYAICSVLASFWHPSNIPLQKMFGAYCIDDHRRGLGRQSNQLKDLKKKYPHEAAVYTQIMTDEKLLKQKLEYVYDHWKTAFIEMSPIEHIENLKCHAISLIHAQTDDIVPPEESIVLEEAIRKKGLNVNAIITPLLNHGDQRIPNLRDIGEILKLINSFALFFSSIE